MASYKMAWYIITGVCNCSGLVTAVVITSVLATLAIAVAVCTSVLFIREKFTPKRSVNIAGDQGEPMYEDISLENQEKAVKLEKNAAYGIAARQ